MALTGGVGRYGHVFMVGKGIDPVTDSDVRSRRRNLLRSDAYSGSEYGAGGDAYGATTREQTPTGGVGLLERSADSARPDFTANPEITAQDVRTALGEDTDTLLGEADLDVDELIRLINAETTMLPPVRLPEELEGDQDPS